MITRTLLTTANGCASAFGRLGDLDQRQTANDQSQRNGCQETDNFALNGREHLEPPETFMEGSLSVAPGLPRFRETDRS
jgi:hypothetical protein